MPIFPSKSRRKGAAVAELAICLPLVFFVIFGSIEVCNLIFLKQAITSAAYEGGLAAIKRDATEADVRQRVETVLNARGIAGTTITISGEGGTLQNTLAGELVSIHIEAETTQNLVSPELFAQFDRVEVDVAGHKQ